MSIREINQIWTDGSVNKKLLQQVSWISLSSFQVFMKNQVTMNDKNYSLNRTYNQGKMSGCPSGLRRQTQVYELVLFIQGTRAFWSTYVGVGSNPTPDKDVFIIFTDM